MSTVITLEQAQAKLGDIIHGLAPGDEIVITENSAPVARLTKPEVVSPKRRPPGLMKGSILYLDPDFDALLNEMRDYTE